VKQYKFGGYAGKYLRVDLSRGAIKTVPLPEELASQFLGGNGFGTKVLWDEVGRDIDPLSPENKLIFAAGPLTGTIFPTAGRLEVISKSPLTGIYGDANAGGHFTPELKRSGFDMIIFEGRSPKPVYLCLHSGEAEVRDASNVWGKGTHETESILRSDLGDNRVQVASIGPAGENLVRYAAVMTHGCAAARAGVGSVMGSKNLKAVAALGNLEIPIAKRDEYLKACLDAQKEILKNPFTAGLARFGTPQLSVPMSEVGRFPTKNHQQGHFEFVEDISAERIEKDHFVRRIACFACPIGCHHIVEVKEGKHKGISLILEYETVNALGARCWNRDLPSIIRADYLCDDYGLDAISTGASIAFAMELHEKGILTRNDTDLDLTWGNSDTVLELITRITYRKELGDILAEGVRRAARAIGKGSEYYAMHIKGQEISAQDGRAQQSMGLAQATSSRGADHLKGFPTIDEMGYPTEAVQRYGKQYLPEIVDPSQTKYKPMVVKDGEEFCAIIDSVGICKFGTQFPPALYWEPIATALSLITGMELNVPKLKTIGERIVNLQRMYNVRHGISRKDDRQPRRLLEEKSPSGRAKGHVVYLDKMLDEYYELRGWDRNTGLPTQRKLNDLGLEYTANELQNAQTKLK
jgi:aldehyde:ferredoxin oxidoreductase